LVRSGEGKAAFSMARNKYNFCETPQITKGSVPTRENQML